jgi:hypothetical protein
MANLVLLATYATRHEALIAQALLHANGVDAFAPDAHIMGAEIDPAWMSGWRLLVDASLAEQAAAILRDAQTSA